MSQGATQIPIASNPPATSPAAMAGDINLALKAGQDGNAGSSPPANYGQTSGGSPGAPVQGQRWLDQSTAAYPVDRIYDGAAWQARGVLDTSQNVYTPISGGAFSLAAAATVDLGSVPSDLVTITGNNGGVPITSFGSSAPIGSRKQLYFASNPVIADGANIICPWDVNLYVRTGATWVVMYLGGGTWIGLAYSDSGGAGAIPPGTLQSTAALVAPDGWLLCYGQTLAIATYPGLYAAIVATATVTITIASPGVVSWTGHPMQNGDPFKARTTGALPTGLTAGTTYYVVNKTANTFQLAATPGGAAINTSGTQSGTHTGYYAPYGDVDANNFLAPDGRSYVLVGQGDMGGTDANRINSQADETLGASFGEGTHTLATAELPSHTHSGTTGGAGAHSHTYSLVGSQSFGGTVVDNYSGGGDNFHESTVATSSAGNHTHNFNTDGGTGGGGAHNNLQPSLVTNLMIKF